MTLPLALEHAAFFGLSLFTVGQVTKEGRLTIWPQALQAAHCKLLVNALNWKVRERHVGACKAVAFHGGAFGGGWRCLWWRLEVPLVEVGGASAAV